MQNYHVRGNEKPPGSMYTSARSVNFHHVYAGANPPPPTPLAAGE